MVKNIYTPLSGALAQQRALETIANNLANVNTTGFKGSRVTFKFLEGEPDKHYRDPLPPANYKKDISDVFPLRGNDLGYVGVAGIKRDMAVGPANKTDNPLDLMIESDGFLTVQTPNGVRYTRDGSLSLGANGVLVTKEGHPVLGEKGNIAVRSGLKVEINPRGEVYQDGNLVDRLAVHRFFDQEALERVGANYYYYGGEPEAREKVAFPAITQGYLEGSNVNAIENLTAMIMAHRSYEAYQKAVANFDQMMDRSSNQLGEVRA